jgi:hypothetical protein
MPPFVGMTTKTVLAMFVTNKPGCLTSLPSSAHAFVSAGLRRHDDLNRFSNVSEVS